MIQTAISPISFMDEGSKDPLQNPRRVMEQARRHLEEGNKHERALSCVLKSSVTHHFSAAGDIVVVPDMPATKLTAATNLDLGLTRLDPDYANWDFYTGLDGQPIDGRGLTFKAHTITIKDITPSNQTSFHDVRAYFTKHGCFGHVGAYTQWRRQNPTLTGFHATVPEDNACWLSPGGSLYIPISCFIEVRRELHYNWLKSICAGKHYTFVAFSV